MRYAYRLETKKIKEPDFPYDTQKRFTSPEDIVAFSRSLQDSDIEKMLVLHLDMKNRLMCIQFFPGTINCSIIHPREIIKHSLLSGSTSLILVHNHPSGDPKESSEDIALTKQIQAAATLLNITVYDHVIIAENGFKSLKHAGLM